MGCGPVSTYEAVEATRVRYTLPRRLYEKEDAMGRMFPCLWFDGDAE